MKKTIAIILLVCMSFSMYSQNDTILGVVEYSLKLNLGLPSENYSKLIFDSTNSSYIEGDFTITSNLENSIDYSNSKKNSIAYFVNTNNNKLYKKDFVNNKNILVEENLPEIKWVINSSEKDTILGQMCNKAIGEFRGRVYTVWYAPNIPVRFGPWKIQGLPGLILKVKDNFNQINFNAVAIQYKNKTDISYELLPPKQISKTIGLKEYINLIEKKELDELKKIMATMPRDSKISNIKLNKDRKSKMEMLYEWEEN